jgi:hypothetical protein
MAIHGPLWPAPGAASPLWCSAKAMPQVVAVLVTSLEKRIGYEPVTDVDQWSFDDPVVPRRSPAQRRARQRAR